METTTGMSAPPMAITMWMPNSSAAAVMMSNGTSPGGRPATGLPPPADWTTNS